MPTDDPVLTLLASANPLPPHRADEFANELDLDAIMADAHAQARSRRRLVSPGPQTTRRPPVVVVALGALLAVVASALAFGYPPAIDFLAAKKAPSWEFVSFERAQRLNAFLTGRPRPPIELAAPARRITDVKFGGRDHVLVVAPLKGGGFCQSWSGPYGGSTCNPGRPDAPIEARTTGDASGPILVKGTVNKRAGAKLELRFQDGETTEIPAVWVSPPIDAGFFLYHVPAAHRHRGHLPASLTLLDASDKPIAHTTVIGGAPTPQRMRQVPGFGPEMIPQAAIYAKRRLLFQVTTAVPVNGSNNVRRRRVGLWIAPARNGGTCTWGAGSIGCGPNHHPNQPLPIEPNFYEGTLCCQVGARVARVELRFQDGDHINVYPKQTYLLAAVPLRHYPRGHRLTEEIAYDRTGHVLASRTIPPNRPARYPCARASMIKTNGFTLCP